MDLRDVRGIVAHSFSIFVAVQFSGFEASTSTELSVPPILARCRSRANGICCGPKILLRRIKNEDAVCTDRDSLRIQIAGRSGIREGRAVLGDGGFGGFGRFLRRLGHRRLS